MKTYTKEIHMQRVAKMLERKDPCGCCPAAPYYSYIGDWELSFVYDNDPCGICQRFLGKKTENCPCVKYGKELAIEKTIKKLKEHGVF